MDFKSLFTANLTINGVILKIIITNVPNFSTWEQLYGAASKGRQLIGVYNVDAYQAHIQYYTCRCLSIERSHTIV